MRSDAIFRFDNSFDVYVDVISQDPLSKEVIREYIYERSARGIVIPSQGSNVYISTTDPVPLRAAVRNMRDRNNTKVFSINDEEYDMYVINATPQYDGFGSIVGWRHTVAREIPPSFNDRLNALRESM